MNKRLLLVAFTTLLSAQSNMASADMAGSAMSGAATKSSSGTTAQHSISPAIHQQFSRLDADKDGYLEKNEVSSMKQLDQVFGSYSVNGKLDELSFAKWEASSTHTPTKVN